MEEPLRTGGNKKAPNIFAGPVIRLEGFCCSLQAQETLSWRCYRWFRIKSYRSYSSAAEVPPFWSHARLRILDKSTSCLSVAPHFSHLLVFRTGHQLLAL